MAVEACVRCRKYDCITGKMAKSERWLLYGRTAGSVIKRIARKERWLSGEMAVM
jgi:hypothetical protein